MPIFENIKSYVNQLDSQSITVDRKRVLQVLINYVQNQVDEEKQIQLNFICTHNSRRSHFTQIWAQTLAYYFNIRINSYSGGTEATALFPKVIETLENIGFEICKLSSEKNPVYAIKFAENTHPIIGFSKKMDNSFNPSSAFAAVMTCSQADNDCPLVLGAEERISLPYEDPKVSDGTNIQDDKYLETSTIIATELHYVFSQIKK